MFPRILDIQARIKTRSALVLGPRQTGKSTLMRQTFGSHSLWIDLLNARTFQTLSYDLSAFEALVQRYFAKSPKDSPIIIVVDEVARLPKLLDSVHLLIEAEPRARFILCSSSARRLKSQGSNLLGGRARLVKVFPLCFPEIKRSSDAPGFSTIDWRDLIRKSGLPSVVTSDEWEDDLATYTDVYLREEIQQEAKMRNLDQFSRFLTVAAGVNGHQIVFEKIGSKAGISAKVCKKYFELLSDTLVGDLLPSFKETVKRQPMSCPKFYLFDAGLARFLQGRQNSDPLDQGEDLETYIYHELKCYREYRRKKFEISYWRSKNQSEVDFIVSESIGGSSARMRHLAIEVKTSRRITGSDFSGLRALAEEDLDLKKVLVNPNTLSRVTDDGIDVLSVDDFLEELWSDRMLPS